MKKAILVEPLLLTNIKRVSPAVYECYSNSALTKHEYIDYGSESEPMFMRLDFYFMQVNYIHSLNECSSRNFDLLQTGYRAGKSYLVSKLSESSFFYSFSKTANCLLNIILNSDYISDSERCMLINKQGKTFYKGPYWDGIYFQAWEQLFLDHAMHNELIKEFNKHNNKFNHYYNHKSLFAYPFN